MSARVASIRIGLGGVAATPLRALAAEEELTGRPWTREVVAAAAEEMARAGTPMSDHRASEAYRIAMLRNSLLKFYAETRRPGHEQGTYGPLADRPDQPVVGLAVSHESADLHVTGAALYTQDLVGRTHGTLHAWPVQAPHAHARVTGLRVEAAYEVPGVVRVLTADDVPGLNDAGEKHDEPLFPSEVMYYGHAVCWVLGETLEAARQGADAVEVDYEPLPALITVHDAIEAGSYQGHQRTVSRGDAAAGLERAALPVQRRARDRRPGALLPGDPGRAGAGRRERADLRPVEHAAPVGDPGHRGARARPARAPGHRAVPADGRRLRRQGVPAARAGRRSPRSAPRSPGTR